jgi:glyoxylase-like metal-dependent hydrolase (beta-lactamase superfamily II)
LAFNPSRRKLGLGITMAIPCTVLGAGPAQAAAGNPRIHRYEAARPFPVNAYIVEGGDSLVVVDATLAVSSAAALRKSVEALGKPLRAVLLTHSHPDHYAGIGILTAGQNVPVVALAAVDDVVRRDDPVKDALSTPLFGAEWPRDRVFASQRVRDGDQLHYGSDLTFTVMDIGPAESLHDSVWILEGERPIAFSGDLLYPLMHCYMADGQIDPWRRAIERLQLELPEDAILYVGHGLPTTPALFSWQRLYLNRFEEAVRSADWREPDTASASVVTAMRSFVPNEQLLFFLEYSIRPNARRLGLL